MSHPKGRWDTSRNIPYEQGGDLYCYEDFCCSDDEAENCPRGGWLTGNPRLVNCPGCLRRMKEQED